MGDEPILLAQIDAAAFGDRETSWTPDNFRTTDALIIADVAEATLLVVATRPPLSPGVSAAAGRGEERPAAMPPAVVGLSSDV